MFRIILVVLALVLLAFFLLSAIFLPRRIGSVSSTTLMYHPWLHSASPGMHADNPVL